MDALYQLSYRGTSTEMIIALISVLRKAIYFFFELVGRIFVCAG